MNTALQYSTRVVQEGGRPCKKSTLNDLVHLTPLRIPLMNPPFVQKIWRSLEPILAKQNLDPEKSIMRLKHCSTIYSSRSFHLTFLTPLHQ
jgi:hypothetical protein